MADIENFLLDIIDFIAPRYFGSFRINEQDQAAKVAGGILRLDYAGDAAFKAYCLMKSIC